MWSSWRVMRSLPFYDPLKPSNICAVGGFWLVEHSQRQLGQKVTKKAFLAEAGDKSEHAQNQGRLRPARPVRLSAQLSQKLTSQHWPTSDFLGRSHARLARTASSPFSISEPCVLHVERASDARHPICAKGEAARKVSLALSFVSYENVGARQVAFAFLVCVCYVHNYLRLHSLLRRTCIPGYSGS